MSVVAGDLPLLACLCNWIMVSLFLDMFLLITLGVHLYKHRKKRTYKNIGLVRAVQMMYVNLPH